MSLKLILDLFQKIILLIDCQLVNILDLILFLDGSLEDLIELLKLLDLLTTQSGFDKIAAHERIEIVGGLKGSDLVLILSHDFPKRGTG